LTTAGHVLWAWLCGVWRDWRSALVIVKPETVIAWYRKGFGLFWTWKIRRGQLGRPPVSKETRKLIRHMSRENPLWCGHMLFIVFRGVTGRLWRTTAAET
jgi:hypothetical protein